MSSSLFKHILIAFLVLASQIMLFRHLSILGSEVDIILIYLIYLMSVHDRTTVLFFASGLGFIQDALLDLWGLNMFAKVSVVMLFYNVIPKVDDPKQPFTRFFVLLVSVTFLHNFMMLGLALFVQSLSASAVITKVLVGNTIFTTFAGSFIHLIKNEK
jgi:rod shape-determining protein MreD